MRILMILLFACGLYGAYQWWQDRSPPGTAAFDTAGFVAVEMPGGVARNTVLVLAPPNCPSEQAQRTEALVRELTRAGIPIKRDSGFDFDIANPTAEQIERIDRTVAVFKRGAPAVFVNGLGMSNPTVEQTIAAYRGSGGRR
ncbi:hypothetical protein [Luteimonas terrae]|uniref:Uncharacterized protein n=1 Tax=Luteimonas terrae TaxID=1530191 RepID=A0A4R5U650_9GAMM|nr:hypothetical protein [Luteimonas terrae]TDK29179.1 hypothetical protein E2F49_14660 [Luteimonas terrae]